MSENTTNQTEEIKPETPETKLEEARKKARNADLIWKAASTASLAITFAYLIILYWGHLFDTTNTVARVVIAIVLLLLLLVTIYFLPFFLKVRAKYHAYSVLYKNTYLKPYLEEAFCGSEYKDYAKVDMKDLMEFSLFKKSRSAQANDCITGSYKNIDFKRYDLALRYKKGNSTSDCVLIVCDAKTDLHHELQIVQEPFKLGSEVYEQPEKFCKILSGSDSFDKKFHVYAREQKEGEKFLKSGLMKRFEKLSVKGSIAAFFDKKKIYLIIKRKRDVMEAPLYRAVDRKKCEKEAAVEVEMIKNWIELLDDCL